MANHIHVRFMHAISAAVGSVLVGAMVSACTPARQKTPAVVSQPSADVQATQGITATTEVEATITVTPTATSTATKTAQGPSPTPGIGSLQKQRFDVRTNMGGGIAYDEVNETIDVAYWDDQPGLVQNGPYIAIRTVIERCNPEAVEPVLNIDFGSSPIHIPFQYLGKDLYEATINSSTAGSIFSALCANPGIHAAMEMEWSCPGAPKDHRTVGTLSCMTHPLADDPSGVIGRPTGGGVCDSPYSGDHVTLYEVIDSTGTPLSSDPTKAACPYLPPGGSWDMWKTNLNAVIPAGATLNMVQPILANGTPNPYLDPAMNPVTIGAVFAPPVPNYGWNKAPVGKCYVMVAELSIKDVTCTYYSPMVGIWKDPSGVPVPVTNVDMRVRMDDPCVTPEATCP